MATAATPDRIDHIYAASNANDVYAGKLLTVQHTAAVKGNDAAVDRLDEQYQRSLGLAISLKSLLSIDELNTLNASIADVKQTTTDLDHDKTSIDGLVKSVDTAATVINDIVMIAGAVAAL